MNKHYRRLVRSESGSSLISTLLLLLFLTFLMTASATVVKNQVVQYKQTSYSYEAKALIAMTETLLLSEGGDSYPKQILFSNGKTVIEKVSDNRYVISATLNNHYTSQKTIEVPIRKSEPEEILEIDSDSFEQDGEDHIKRDQTIE
ncbi:hypothetical protein [Alkalibacterium olivapovliticus]|uniref:Competence protein ComGG n=1 Tax=Alkalibacterium olivapovliticus TaxID=99907 RepID=A0A2T0W653_9LACT|nr:hypothetical protein [Alkalibacterium olivapovliticus]PRY82169.1 hypothetical protein CLV38_11521 [Alkalibacterium olivapovliticus]